MKSVLFVLFVMVAMLGFGQTLTTRYDSQGPIMSGQTLGYDGADGVSIWGLGIDTPFPEFDFGYLKQVYADKHVWVLAGGYASVWPTTQQWFAQPWLLSNLSSGNMNYHLDLVGFIPVTKGPYILFVNDASAMYRISSRISLGAQATFWDQQEVTPRLRFGPRVKFSLTKDTDISVSALVYGNKQGDIRVVGTVHF